jgi:hypothetical protein
MVISTWTRFFLPFVFLFLVAVADQTVYLVRPGFPNGDNLIYEPLFNPKSIWASVGEKITFQTILQDISHMEVKSPNRMLNDSMEVSTRSFGLLGNLPTLHLAHSSQMVSCN